MLKLKTNKKPSNNRPQRDLGSDPSFSTNCAFLVKFSPFSGPSLNKDETGFGIIYENNLCH